MQLTTDRRSVLKLGMIGAAGLAAPQIVIRAAYAQADGQVSDNPGFRSFKIGSFELTTIQDGLRPGEGPHPIFGSDQPAETVAQLLEANFLPSDRFVNGFTPTLVKAGSELILFDTGLGEGAREGGLGKLRERLQAAGHQPEDVTIVVITHFHPDHIGGLTEGGAPAFANARYVMSQAEYDFWTAPERMSGPTEQVAKLVDAKVKPLAEKTTFIGDGAEVVPGITGMDAPGHTPGHMIFHMESDGQRLVLTADTCNHYVASLQRPDWHVQFDTDKELGASTRTEVFDMIAAERLPFIGYHMPFPSIGYVEKVDAGYRYVPMSYQLDL